MNQQVWRGEGRIVDGRCVTPHPIIFTCNTQIAGSLYVLDVLKKGTKATVSKYQERTKGNIWEYFVKCVSLTITSGIFG